MKKFLSVLLAVVSVFCIAFAGCVNEQPKQTELSEADKDILRYHREPNIEENFEDNEVWIILKSAYDNLEEIRFEDLKIIEKFSRITKIWYNLNEYTYDDEKIPLEKGETNHMFEITLEEHSKEKVLEICKLLETLDMVLCAEPDYIHYTPDNWIPSDIKYSNQWGLNSENGINAEKAWDITRGSIDIKVGIMENNIDMNHMDLSGRVHLGNFNPTANARHGTAVAGIIGAIQNNDTGIAGIAGVAECSIYLLQRDIPKSLKYAEENNIKIINASFEFIIDDTKKGPDNYDQYNSTDYESLKKFSGLFIASAGNDGNNNDERHHYPSDYDLPNVISVGYHDSTGKNHVDSNYGKATVDLFAPGTSIYTTLPSNSFGYTEGTSMAAPFVTGVAALIYAKCPDITASAVKSFILNNVDKVDSLKDLCITGGKLNAYKAVNAAHTTIHPESYYYLSKDQHSVMCVDCNITLRNEKHYFIFESLKSTKRQCTKCGFTIYDDFVSRLKEEDKKLYK